MKDVEVNRRKLLAGIGGAGLIESLAGGWVKPVVDVVVLPSHAMTSEPIAPELQCEFERGEEGFSPRVGATFVIDTVIRVPDSDVADGDSLTARHQVVEAGYDETFPGNITVVGPNAFVGGLPFSVPLPPGVAAGQTLDITVTMTGGDAEGRSCSGSLDID